MEPFDIGSVVHIVKRGARGMEISRDDADKWRFVRNLYILNDLYQPSERHRERNNDALFSRPAHWPKRKPLVSILAWTLMPNHFHLLLCEQSKGGVPKFMQRLGSSMTRHYNEKYQERGSLFQGAYKSRTVSSDEYLQYVLSYIIVKNVFELYPGGLRRAVKNFDQAWQWATSYPFSSFQTTAFFKSSPIVDSVKLKELSLPGRNFKKTSRDMLDTHASMREDLAPLVLEDW